MFSMVRRISGSPKPERPALSPGTYSPEDDPLAVAVFQGASELRGQLLFINVCQQIANRAQHNHLQTKQHCELADRFHLGNTQSKLRNILCIYKLGLLYILFYSIAFFLRLWPNAAFVLHICPFLYANPDLPGAFFLK